MGLGVMSHGGWREGRPSQVCEADAEITVGGTCQGLVKCASFEECIESNEKIGALNVGITHQCRDGHRLGW